jgi:polysaccharide biosynthesis protein PslJ
MTMSAPPTFDDPVAPRAHQAPRGRPYLTPQLVSTVGLLVVFLAAQYLIPARLVISGMGAAGRPAVAVGLLLGLLWLLSAVVQGRLPPGPQPIRWVLAAHVLMQLVGYAVGFQRGPTAAEASSADRWMILTFALAGVTLAVCDGVRTRRDLDVVLRALVALTAAVAVVGIIQFVGFDLTRYITIPGLSPNSVVARGDLRGDLPRVWGTTDHYIEFGVLLATTAPLALHYALVAGRAGRSRLLAWVQVLVIVAAIPMSISRSAVLTTVVVLILMLAAWRWPVRLAVLTVVAAALTALYLVGDRLLATLYETFALAEQDPSVLARLADRSGVVDVWLARPWLGHGAGMTVPESYVILDNQYFATLIATGAVGLVVFVALFAVPYFVARSIRLRAPLEEDRHLAQSLAVAFPGALFAAATFDTFFFTTHTAQMFVLIGAVGALWRLTRRRGAPPTASPDDRLLQRPVAVGWRDAWVRRDARQPQPAGDPAAGR